VLAFGHEPWSKNCAVAVGKRCRGAANRCIRRHLPVAADAPCGRVHARSSVRHHRPTVRARCRTGRRPANRGREQAGGGLDHRRPVRAAKDGYGLFLPALSTLTNQIINPAPALDLNRDFAPIALLAIGAVVLVVNPASNVHSVPELIALAKAKPGQARAAGMKS